MLGGSFQAVGEISLISHIYSQLNPGIFPDKDRYRDIWLLSLVKKM